MIRGLKPAENPFGQWVRPLLPTAPASLPPHTPFRPKLVFAIRSAQVGRLEAEVPALHMQVGARACCRRLSIRPGVHAARGTPPPTRPCMRVIDCAC